MTSPACRNCRHPLAVEVADLGMQPLSNAFLREEQLDAMERFYPLRALVCERCFLVQLAEFESPETIFSDYVYFSSWSTSWLAHARRFVDQSIERLGLDSGSRVVEVASNDGYLLQYFVDRGIPALGVEPAANVAEVARERGVPTESVFFGADTASALAQDGQADLLVANNVLAHVPDIHDFVEGFARLLAPTGSLSVEFPHLLRLVEGLQYDTIYHEHFSYLSLSVVIDVFARHGLRVVDVEEVPTHGGSLRVWARHDHVNDEPSTAVGEVLAAERAGGLGRLETYQRFGERVAAHKRAILMALIGCREEGLSVAAYGAAAKGNTLLNYCGIDKDLIGFVVDVSTDKQGRFLPGTHLPVFGPDALDARRPDVVFVLPWNIQEEIVGSLERIRSWGGRFLLQRPALGLVP